MKTCKTCNCPLMLLTQERRTMCARCHEAAQAKKVYRAPKVPPPRKDVVPSLADVAAFMEGSKRDEAPPTTLFDRG